MIQFIARGFDGGLEAAEPPADRPLGWAHSGGPPSTNRRQGSVLLNEAPHGVQDFIVATGGSWTIPE